MMLLLAGAIIAWGGGGTNPTRNEPVSATCSRPTLACNRSLLGHKEEMLLSSLYCLECNNWKVYCVCLCNTLVVHYMCCCYNYDIYLCFLLDRPVVCPHNESTILLAGPAKVGHWFAHEDLRGQLSPEATEK